MLNKCLIVSIAFITFLQSNFSLAADKTEKLKSQNQQRRLKVNPMTDFESAWAATIETDIYDAGTFENFTAVYSAQNNWDLGVSLLNVQILGSNNTFQGEPFFSLSKAFDVNEKTSITLGTLNGLTLGNKQPQSWLNFNFFDIRISVSSSFKLHGGPYYANRAITGISQQVGYLTGTEFDFIANRLSFQLDYISGHHALSGANINMIYNLKPKFQIYLGVYVPEQNSGNEFAGIIGFNLSTHNL